MTALLAFLLECAAIATAVGTAGALAALAVRPILPRLGPARRADLAFLAATAPAVLALAVVAAAAAPSLAGALGLAVDHCQGHSHHVHLCLVHATGLRPTLAVLGAFSLAVFAFRTGALAFELLDGRRRVRGLEALGTRASSDLPVVRVPGSPTLCHAVGIVRPRVLLSAALADALNGDELDAALAHEAAHLRRRDPLARLALAVAALFVPPGVAARLARSFHEAAEEACDEDAACAVGDPALVAAALLKVVSLRQGQRARVHLAPAFGEEQLEARVRRLLEPRPFRRTPARALWLVAVFGAAAWTAALSHAPALHHAVETALHHLF